MHINIAGGEQGYRPLHFEGEGSWAAGMGECWVENEKKGGWAENACWVENTKEGGWAENAKDGRDSGEQTEHMRRIKGQPGEEIKKEEQEEKERKLQQNGGAEIMTEEAALLTGNSVGGEEGM
ncbi:hypothetical protein MLD38_006788 [Melastoma candidum]|uniref:Uncharacterized protein n=1 Tax=Melastoma candidum TaxID=119954 RepID=A0ACB9RQC1_9MYRT|nr:hypothetical protein MLD38_006788 [Melastoma candidum]